MANEKVLRVLMRYGVDKQSIDEVRRGIKSVEDALVESAEKGQQGFKGTGKEALATAAVFGVVTGAVIKLTDKLFQMATQAVASFKQIKAESLAVNKSFETYVTQFETFLKSRPAATQLIKDLQAFNIATPFELPNLVEGAKLLQTFGDASLNTAENWKMIGDAAASVNQPFERAAFWIGRMYSNLQAGRPFGEASMAMQEMGIVSGELRTKLEDMQKAGADSNEIWKVFTDDLSVKFEGGAERLSKTLVGIESNLADVRTELLRVGGESYFEQVKEDSQALLDLLSDPDTNADLQALARGIGEIAANFQKIITSGFFDNFDAEWISTVKDIVVELGIATELLTTTAENVKRGKTGAAGAGMPGEPPGIKDWMMKYATIPGLWGTFMEQGGTQGLAVTAKQIDYLYEAGQAYFQAANAGKSHAEAMEAARKAGEPYLEQLQQIIKVSEDYKEKVETGTTATEKAQAAEAARMAGLAKYYEEQAALTAEQEKAKAEYEAAVKAFNDAIYPLDMERAKKRWQIDKQAAEDRVALEKKLAQDLEDINRKHSQRLEDAAEDLSEKEQDIAKDYARQRIELEQNTARERQQVERDHQQRLRDIEQEFTRSSEEALRSQDAIGYLRAMRRRNEQLEDARDERRDRITENEITAEEERQQAQIDYQQKLEDADIYHQRKLEDLKQQLDRELEEQRLKEQREREQIDAANNAKTEQMKSWYNAKYAELKKALQKELELIFFYEAEKKRAQSSGTQAGRGGQNYTGYTRAYGTAYEAAFAGRQSGGYVGAGIYAMGEAGREFVLANSTTAAAERVLGPLTQGSIMAAIGARNVTNNFAPQFNFSERDDARLILGQVQQMIRGEMLRIERGY